MPEHTTSMKKAAKRWAENASLQSLAKAASDPDNPAHTIALQELSDRLIHIAADALLGYHAGGYKPRSAIANATEAGSKGRSNFTELEAALKNARFMDNTSKLALELLGLVSDRQAACMLASCWAGRARLTIKQASAEWPEITRRLQLTRWFSPKALQPPSTDALKAGAYRGQAEHIKALAHHLNPEHYPAQPKQGTLTALGK